MLLETNQENIKKGISRVRCIFVLDNLLSRHLTARILLDKTIEI
jgi:hypothetical protein